MISFEAKQMAITLIEQAQAAGAALKPACELIGISARTYRRWCAKQAQTGRIEDARQTRKHGPYEHALSQEEKQHILQICNSAAYQSLPPTQIVPALAQQGLYIASESSFYRVLKAHDQLHRRGRSQSPRKVTAPEPYVATAANQIWSWDITYLPSTVKGRFWRLYLILDVFSRVIVKWEVYEHEDAELAAQLVRKACLQQGVQRNQLVLHADNGSAMKASTMLATLQHLGVVPSFSRPAVSNDNAYSESLFKTLKYTPAYPSKPFESLDGARQWVQDFAHWYNHEHRHSGIGFVTPMQRHTGADVQILAQRKQVYEQAKARHPERWKTRQTRNCLRIDSTSLNPTKELLTPENFTFAA